MESTVGVVKKGLEVQEHTVKVSNKWLMYLQPVGLFRVKMAIFMNNKEVMTHDSMAFWGYKKNLKIKKV